jgi:hypothetical protein
MSSSIPNLWPTDLAPTVERTPLAILKEQAAQLGAQTKNLLEGRVDTETSPVPLGQDRSFFHTLNVVAPALGNYTYRLLGVRHSLELYPLNATFYGSPSGQPRTERLSSEADFIEYLRTVFASDETRRVIGALLAQVQS